MSHYLTIDDSWDELRLKLVCTATPDAPCRKRPTDDRETWHDDDPDLTGPWSGRRRAAGRRSPPLTLIPATTEEIAA